METKAKSNKQLMILSAIGIIIMVICHFGGEIYKFIKIFPFVPIFVFVSGYFYKEENEQQTLKFIWHKFKKLMIPFFICNLIYGIIVNILNKNGIILYGEKISFYTLFIQPFINNNQFIFNFPAWFVPTLFLINIFYIIIHKIFNKTKIKYKEEIELLIFIILNILSIYFMNLISQNKYIIILLRVMFFIPFMQMGNLYKNKYQKYDEKIPNIFYLIICILINFILSKIYGKLEYDPHEFNGFVNMYIPIISSTISILFYMRISKILSKYIGENKIINYISNNTYSIMTHHIFALFIFNFILYLINVPYFNIEKFQKGWIYIYEIPNFIIPLQIIYILIGIFLPLIFKKLYDKIYNFIVTNTTFFRHN